MIYSIKKLVNLFQTIADNHQEIFTFGYGDISDIDQKTERPDAHGNSDTFIGIWAQHDGTQLILGKNTSSIQRRFSIYCYDLQRQDEGSQYSIWNQTEQILIDFCRLMAYSSSDYRIVNNPTITPFQDKFSNDVNGMWCQLTIETVEYVGKGDIPILNNEC